MSGLANPRKDFRFLLELDGVNMFLIQEIDEPTVEYDVVEHGAPGNIPNAKTPGKVKVGDLVVRKLQPAQKADIWAWEWFGAATAGIKKDFVKKGVLKHLAPDGVRTIQSYVLGDVWPMKIENSTLNAQGSNNQIQTVTFAVQLYFTKESPILQALFAGSAALAGGAAFLAGNNN